MAGGLVEVDERGREEGVVVEVGVLLGPAPRPDMQEPLARTQPRPRELGGPDGGVDESRHTQHAARLGERADHERVPAGQDLFVAQGRDALGARREQAGASSSERGARILRASAEHLRHRFDG